MTKTFTPTNFKSPTDLAAVDQLESEDFKFYSSLKPKLNDLKREPSDETITKILDYAKKR